jgi:hypothetical protein
MSNLLQERYVPIRGAPLSILLHVSLISSSHHNPSTEPSHSCMSHSHTVYSTVLVPISYRGALLNPLLHIRIIPSIHKRPGSVYFKTLTLMPSTYK